MDVPDAPKWELRGRGVDFNGLEGTWTWWYERTLYQQTSGLWVLVEHGIHCEIDADLGWTTRVISPVEAATLLMESGRQLPTELAAAIAEQRERD